MRRPTSPEIAVDLGNALAAIGEHDRALVEFGRGIETAKGKTRAIAFYDRATSLFRLGRILEARAAYVEALRLDATDRDAKFNIEVIDRILGFLGPPVAKPSGSPGQRTLPPGQSAPPAGGSPQATTPSNTEPPGRPSAETPAFAPLKSPPASSVTTSPSSDAAS